MFEPVCVRSLSPVVSDFSAELSSVANAAGDGSEVVVSGVVSAGGPGRFSVSYVTTVATTMSLSVRLYGIGVGEGAGRSPFAVDVKAADISARAS